MHNQIIDLFIHMRASHSVGALFYNELDRLQTAVLQTLYQLPAKLTSYQLLVQLRFRRTTMMPLSPSISSTVPDKSLFAPRLSTLWPIAYMLTS